MVVIRDVFSNGLARKILRGSSDSLSSPDNHFHSEMLDQHADGETLLDEMLMEIIDKDDKLESSSDRSDSDSFDHTISMMISPSDSSLDAHLRPSNSAHESMYPSADLHSTLSSPVCAFLVACMEPHGSPERHESSA